MDIFIEPISEEKTTENAVGKKNTYQEHNTIPLDEFDIIHKSQTHVIDNKKKNENSQSESMRLDENLEIVNSQEFINFGNSIESGHKRNASDS